jgi:hypothetical protein
MPGTRALLNLQNKCSGEVNSLTPNNGDFGLSGIANVRRSFNVFICLYERLANFFI